ncbi:uncharacterized protein G2W53_037379 [Senna tora]|uniref:Uncharacterized protein n=1 Tax=Senna tora TaxID=362788 RepID=A0A834W9K8_9FABA|nr:uncharacterized protein G2W53_037379 [Senna tora]
MPRKLDFGDVTSKKKSFEDAMPRKLDFGGHGILKQVF